MSGSKSCEAFPSNNGMRIILPNIVSLTKSIMRKKRVQLINHCIGALPIVSCLIAKVVDLALEGLTVNTKDGTLPGCEEDYWARLQRITWVVHLESAREKGFCQNWVLSMPITYY